MKFKENKFRVDCLGLAEYKLQDVKIHMNYRKLGNTDIKVSEIGFGAWGIGGVTKDAKAYGPTNDNVSREALLAAYELGITFYDTAALYGYGHSEELIGSTLKNVRDNIIIASKVGFVSFNGDQNFTEKYIRKSLEQSLRRLHTDYIDLYQLHDPPIELLKQNSGIVKTLDILKQEGKIRTAGISVRSPRDGLLAADLFGVDAIQVNFNLLDQRILENGLIRKCKANGVGIVVRTPLCFGFLTGKYKAEDKYNKNDHRSRWNKKQIELWSNAYKLFASETDKKRKMTEAQIAICFCLSHEEVSTVIPGMLTKDHVKENAESSRYSSYDEITLRKFYSIYRKNNFIV